jgi:DNA-directed RNA polymerase II subunit RPB1
LKAVWELAKTKMVCEGGDDIDGGEMGDEMEMDEHGNPQPKKKSHGGCGHRQPIFRKEGLGLSVNFKANANDVGFIIYIYMKIYLLRERSISGLQYLT